MENGELRIENEEVRTTLGQHSVLPLLLRTVGSTPQATVVDPRFFPFPIFHSPFSISHFPFFILLTSVVIWSFLAGCQTPRRVSPTEATAELNERHLQRFGDAELPRKIGSVENCGLLIPVIAPDGRRMLYLRTDQDHLSPMTLLGSPDPRHTPTEGTLSIWIRPVEGAALGRALSPYRWAHSGTWSDSGNAVAYVANEPPESFIVHVDLNTGRESVLGVPGGLNCLPRFDGDDQTLLFCAAAPNRSVQPKPSRDRKGADNPSRDRKGADTPFRTYRQRVGDAMPTALTPAGPDCLLPVRSDRHDGVLCARADGQHLDWVEYRGGSGPEGRRLSGGGQVLAAGWGSSAEPALLQTWACIATPLSPDRDAVLYYDIAWDRVCVLHVAERTVRRHRSGSMAACWLDTSAIALATPNDTTVVNATTGMSVPLFNGQWIPSRYVAAERRLILLGRQTPRRFAIWEVIFRPKAEGK